MLLKEVNILLADDDTDDCIFFKKALEKFAMPTHLIAVNDGEQLMNLLTDETNELPHILFLDINMPRKNGFECLSEIKHNSKLKKLPVIVFSTSFEQEVVNLLYKNGAHYFIRKPADFLKYKEIIQQSLTLVTLGDVSQPNREHFVLKVQNS